MNTDQLQKALGLSFKDQGLLRQALTHPSYLNEHPYEVGGSNQRLEFLGDAFIGVVVAHELYRRHPHLDEGDLTEERSYLVRGQTLARVARHLGLGRYLLLGQGEAASGGRDRDSNLAAALEALAGALMLDRGQRAARRFVLWALQSDLNRVESTELLRDPKSRLQELAHREGRGDPRYEVTATEGPAHERLFTVQVMVDEKVVGTGRGRRRVDAEQQAALVALRHVFDTEFTGT